MGRIPEKEIKRALAVAQQIRGMCRPVESRFLYRLARRKGDLVEIGCWQGYTTAIFLQAARVWGARLTTVDPFIMPEGYGKVTADTWRANLRRIGLVPPPLLEMTSDEAAAVYRKRIAFLFIDGGHDRAVVAGDLAKWTPRVQMGGLVAMHDMFHFSITGVAQAVVEWWCAERDGRKARWRPVGMYDHTIAFRRVR